MAKTKRARRLPKVKTGWRVYAPNGRELVASKKADFREKGVRFLLLRVK
jgi:hypothetical protein